MKEESLLLLSDLQKLINQVVLIDYTIIILGDDCLNQRPTREQVERLRRQYPAGTRITLHSMDDPQAPPPGTKGTVAYVDDMGTIGIEWDNGSALSLIPGEDSFSKEASPEKTKHKRSCDLER